MSELNPAGMHAARRYAYWYLGDSSWAKHIIDAYNNPAETNAMLDKEQE